VTITSFELEATPRPRAGTAVPGAFGPWTLTGVGVAALRLALIGCDLQGTSVGTGSPVTGPLVSRLVTPAAPVATIPVRNSINRKQYVYTTRAHAGGDGASGPYPEWEPV